MLPNLHVDPATPRAVAAALAAAPSALRAAALDDGDLAVLATLPGGPALVAEHDRLVVVVRGRLRELAEVVDGLEAAAAEIDAAEQHALSAIGAVSG